MPTPHRHSIAAINDPNGVRPRQSRTTAKKKNITCLLELQLYSETCLERPLLERPRCQERPFFQICENFYLPLDSMQTEPVWNDHLSGRSTQVSLYIVELL